MEENLEEREVKKTTEFLKCILTDKEKKSISEELARAVEEIEKNEDDLKATSTQFKSKIAENEAIMRQAASKIRNGYEMRRVECEVEKNFKTGSIVCTRLDNMDIVYERAMTADERQPKLIPKND
jgi:hypothetical protein